MKTRVCQFIEMVKIVCLYDPKKHVDVDLGPNSLNHANLVEWEMPDNVQQLTLQVGVWV